MSTDNFEVKPDHFGFLLVPNYSMIAFSLAIEALRMANRAVEKTLYTWGVYTIDGKPVYASNGLEVTPDDSIENAGNMVICFV
ncbi:MAG: GlxA family transcriptional regulator, partial [Gammaproteobacteria bacterium]|nr:GlxA family transcriptional regulator [Gammaproteobacteria bacterium]